MNAARRSTPPPAPVADEVPRPKALGRKLDQLSASHFERVALCHVERVRKEPRRLGRLARKPLAIASSRATGVAPSALSPSLKICEENMRKMLNGEKCLDVGDLLAMGESSDDGLRWFVDFWERVLSHVVLATGGNPVEVWERLTRVLLSSSSAPELARVWEQIAQRAQAAEHP